MILSKSKTDKLDIEILKFYMDETAIIGIKEFLFPGVASIALSERQWDYLPRLEARIVIDPPIL